MEVFYCTPGIDGAHEKGGVEGEVGRFRRNPLVPVPDVTSLAELNAQVDAWDRQDDQRRIGERPRTVGEYFAIEKPLLQPMPEDHFETGRLLTPRVDRYAQITVRMNHYSVPVRLIGRQVRVLLHACELVVYDGRTEVARHERLASRRQPPGPGPLPGRTAAQTRSTARRHRAGSGPGGREVHPGARRLVGGHPPRTR
uniref:Transposase for insertion sequence element IS21-like C-terminal domain-containing protein n=1 Tax=Streptomyces sp. NBC_00003 TaxID=2903608 RepID=A0AAU2VGG8_9ACTN